MTPLGLYRDMHNRPDWHLDALCVQTDPDAFFPEKGGTTRDGKRVCQVCPVKAECLAYALEHREQFGIWGGLSAKERDKLVGPIGYGHGRILSEKQERQAADLLKRGMTVSEVARQFGVTFTVIGRLRKIYDTMNGEAA